MLKITAAQVLTIRPEFVQSSVKQMVWPAEAGSPIDKFTGPNIASEANDALALRFLSEA